ncbi:hypothetical protein DSO57_1015887 [Entomophthora muscae]|uniref:Uncharacterized protein n=1 Tax=Entomophthora muscae TaxID=34485 RepID=A0ACC2S714_9FUNG|nr:hypothetical protein DSO57_1015887 [Entomophthora muscae]
MYLPPGAPFGLVHFTEYPLKPEYKDYTADNIIAQDPLARTTNLTRYNRKGPWYVTKPRLFRDKYNFLPAYQVDMEPPAIPKPMPASAAELPLDHTNKLFRIVYITLTGVIDTIVPAAGPWSWVGKSMSYLIKLAPILWWALPTQSAIRQFPNTSEPADQGWFPETQPKFHYHETEAHVKELTNWIIDIQASNYTSAYRVKSLEFSPSNASRTSFSKF